MIDGDGVVAETEDAVEAAKGESKTWLVGGFAKILIFDCQIAYAQDIVGNEAGDFS